MMRQVAPSIIHKDTVLLGSSIRERVLIGKKLTAHETAGPLQIVELYQHLILFGTTAASKLRAGKKSV